MINKHLRRYVLPLAILIACLLFLAATPVHAAPNGRITGQLLDGSNKNTLLAGQKVTLQMAQGENASDLTTAITDTHGTFSFNNLATDKTISYAVYIRYQGAQYVSDVVSLDSNPLRQVNLTVYQATTHTDKIAIVQSSVLLHQADARKGTFTVSEILAFDNLDTHTYVGSLDASKGKPNALLFSLPQGARNISLSRGFDGYQVLQVDHGFATNAALPPGNSEFAFAFDVPYTSSNYDFSYTTMYPTVVLAFLVPPDVHTTSSVLTSPAVITAQQQPYRLLKTNQLLANQAIHVKLEGLPTPTQAHAASATNTNTIWLIVGLLIMIAIIFITSFFYRMQQRLGLQKQPKKSGWNGWNRNDGQGAKGMVARASKHPAPASISAEQEEVLLQELLNLDSAFDAGKLSKSLYQERRAKTKARLRAVLSEPEDA